MRAAFEEWRVLSSDGHKGICQRHVAQNFHRDIDAESFVSALIYRRGGTAPDAPHDEIVTDACWIGAGVIEPADFVFVELSR